MNRTEEVKCRLTKNDKVMQAFSGFASLMSFPAQLYFMYILSKRSSKHFKKLRIITPKQITFRIYSPGISGGQFTSVALWSYGIPTLLVNAYKGCDHIDGQCCEYIEITQCVPSSRHFQADLLMRQHINNSFHGITIMTPPVFRDGHSTLEYAEHEPMVPKGIPYKPVMLMEKILIWVFQGQLNELPGSHKQIAKAGGTKRQSVVKPNTVQTPKKRSIKKPTKRVTKPEPKRQTKNAKLFD